MASEYTVEDMYQLLYEERQAVTAHDIDAAAAARHARSHIVNALRSEFTKTLPRDNDNTAAVIRWVEDLNIGYRNWCTERGYPVEPWAQYA
jgi:hypothetical protein